MSPFSFFFPILTCRGIVLSDEPGTTLVLQLAENGNLRDAFESNQYVFRYSRKIQWMKQLGQALEWIHEVWGFFFLLSFRSFSLRFHFLIARFAYIYFSPRLYDLTRVAQSPDPSPSSASGQSASQH
jgi:hypothetical protein